MAARVYALLPRLAALTLIWLLATSALTFAASGRAPRKAPPVRTPETKQVNVLVVPDVRRQAYVFAKGILEDGGFAWRVTGGVQGYAANTVATQQPAPGTRVVDTGSPRITLRVARNTAYAERGLPDNASPYAGTEIVLATEAAGRAASPASAPAAQPAAPAAAPAKKPAKPVADAAEETDAAKGREPAFVVPGAPAEPLDEMPLPDRARLVERRVSAQAKPTKALVQYWLYQHAWIVTGARFGWSGGAEALKTLVRVDEDLQARWGIGARSERVARAALAEVSRKAGT